MKQSFITKLMAQIAQEEGVTLLVEPNYGYVAQIPLPDGRKRYFRNTVFDLNGAGATEIAKDKDYASFFLAKCGYPVPQGESFHTRHWARAIESARTPGMAWEYAQKIGLPVIVKPNSKSQGNGVALVHTKREFMSAVAQASAHERVFLVQQAVRGKDYRIVVLDGEVISAYERRPLMVTGDGTSSIQMLLETKQQYFIEIERDTVLRLDDPRLNATLRRMKLTRDSILSSGDTIKLLANANLSSGGDAVDVTPSIHLEWKKLAAAIARDMNLRYIGIDVMTEAGLDTPPGEYTVIEVNAAPGLDNYAAIGTEQMHIVKELYRKVLKAMLI